MRRSPHDHEIFRLAPLGAHQIAFQLWTFLALVLDAVAVAGQVIVGRMLGAGDADGAHAASIRMIGWSVGAGILFAVLLPLAQWIPRAFTGDRSVIHEATLVWPLFALMQPLAGAVFALDGILIGASDTRYMMWSVVASTLVVFIPVSLLSLHFDWGIVGVWCGITGLIAARLTLLGARFASRRSAVVGWA
ncbi:MAG: MATE family efflux transporter [Actinomycetota bacterium]|nr:MATE family efflux transporter [Actinomycetota bacterium]